MKNTCDPSGRRSNPIEATRRRVIAILATCCVLMLGSAGCGEKEEEDVVRIAFRRLPENLNPLLAMTTEDRYLADLVFDGLFNRSGFGPDAFEPAIAATVVQETGNGVQATSTYHVRLNPGVPWHDSGRRGAGSGCSAGRKIGNHMVTVEDVLFTWSCIQRRENKSPFTPRVLAMIRSIERDNKPDYDLRVVFKKPEYIGWVPADLGFCKIIPKEANGRALSPDLLYDPGSRAFAESPVGSGPFLVVERKRKAIRLEAARPGGIPTVEIVEIPALDVQAKSLLNGGVDICFDLPTEIHHRLLERGIRCVEFLPFRFYAVAMNTRKDPTRDVRLRQALAAAVSREGVLEAVLPPGSDPSKYVMKSPYPANAHPILARLKDKNPYAPETAKQILSNIGVPNQPLTLLYPDRLGQTAERIAAKLIEYWDAIGVEVDAKPAGVAFDPIVQQGNYELALVLEEGFDHFYAIERLYYSHSATNRTGLQIVELDHLLQEMESHITVAEKAPLCRELNEILGRHVPYIYLFTLPSRMYYSSKIQDVDIQDANAPLASMERWGI